MGCLRRCGNHDYLCPSQHLYVLSTQFFEPAYGHTFFLIVIARILKKMQEQQMKNRDKRTRLMSELLNNIKRYVLHSPIRSGAK